MKNQVTLLALAASAIFAATPVAAAGIMVTLMPSAQHVSVGDTVTVNASISGLGTEVLAAMDLDLLFNSTVLGNPRGATFSAAEFGGVDSFFDVFVSLAGDTEVQAGTLLSDADLAAIQTDNAFQFLTYSFTALADGTTFLNYGPDLNFERNFVGLNFASLDVMITGACVAVGTGVCVIPEPSSYALASLALAGMFVPGAIRRRRERSL